MTDEARTVVETYCAAWNETDTAARRSLLDAAWADDGTYTDPRSDLAGRDALSRHIGERQKRMPGARIVMTSGVDVHHGLLRFGWKLVDSGGATVLEGVDIGELAADGRLRKIIGFFGPLPGLR